MSRSQFKYTCMWYRVEEPIANWTSIGEWQSISSHVLCEPSIARPRVDRVATQSTRNPINLLSVFSHVRSSVRHAESRKLLKGINLPFVAELSSTANTPHAKCAMASFWFTAYCHALLVL